MPPGPRPDRRRPRRRPTSLVGLICSAFVLALLPLSVVPPAAEAAVRQAFAPVFSADENGAISIVGNSQMSCSSNRSGCANARAGSGSEPINNSWTMAFLDTDSSNQTTNSTSADLAMPTGSTVLNARLVWGGRLTAGDGGTAGGSTYNRVKLRTPGASTYATLTATTVIQPSAISDFLPYQASLDVTSLVSAAGNGSYAVGDIVAGTGEDRYAGWSLVVAYRNPSLPLRNLVVFEGFADVTSGSNSSVNTTVSGFLTPAAGSVNATVGFVAWEGDLPTEGDTLKFNGTVLSEPTRPSNNTFNSNITNLGVQQTTRTPSYPNTFGVDMGRVSANGVLPNNATSATVNVATSGDIVYLGLLTTEIDLFSPSFVGTSKAVTNLSGHEPAQAGDLLEYTLSFTNTGGDFADAVVLRDPLPTGVSYVPGSIKITSGAGASSTAKTDAVGDDVGEYVGASRLVRVRLGTGATTAAGGTLAVNASTTVKFRATVDRSAAGTTVTNGASLDYRARTLARNYTFTTNTVATPVGLLADLAITKTSTPASQDAGSAVTYTLTVSNTGPNAATGVVATDTLPAGLTYVSSSPPSGTTCSRSGQVVTCTVGTLANGASVAIPLVATISQSTTAGSLLDTATVSADTADDDLSDNTATAATTVTRSADLQLTKTGPAGAVAGGRLTYVVTVANAGPSTATAVTVADSLPLGLTFVSATPSSGSCTNETPTISCALGDLGAGGTRTVTVVADLAPAFTAASITNAATATSGATEADPDDNTDAVTTPVTRDADVAVTKTASPASPGAGTEITYTVTVTNTGRSDAADVALSDAVPTGMSVVRATPTQGSCNIEGQPVTCALGVLTPGGTARVTLVGLVAAGRDPGPLTNSASVTTSTPQSDTDDDTASVTSTVVGRADLSLTKVGSPDPAPVGEAVVYTLTVGNAGPSQARQVVVTDTLPEQVSLIDAPGCSQAGRTLTCPVGLVEVGGTAEVTIAVAIPNDLPEGTQLSNSAAVAAGTTDPVAANNAATFVSSGSTAADVSLTKSTSPETLVPGEQVTYTLTAANAGPSLATGVVVTDTLPDGVSYVSSTPEGACTASAGIVTCSLGSVGGDTTSVTITADVDPDLTDLSSTNVASVATEVNDPTTSNNTASSVATVAPSGDVAVTIAAVTEQVRAGATAEYAVTLTNLGSSSAAGVVVTGQVPDGLLPVPGSSGGACTVNDRTVRCVLPAALAPGATLTIPLLAVVAPSTPPGSVSATAYVGSTTADANPDNNASTDELVVLAEADLVVAKSADPDPAVAGGTLTYTLSVTNEGPSDAVGVTLTDTLPAGLSGITATPSLGSCTLTGPTVDCAVERLAPDGVLTVSVTALVDAAQTESLTNTASAAAETDEPEGDGEDSAVTITTPVLPSADVRLTKSADLDEAVAGQAIEYTITVYNAGPSDARNVDVEDSLPAGLTFAGGTPPEGASCEFFTTFGQCFFPVLAAGASRSIAATVLVSAELADGASVTNSAVATTSTPVAEPDDLTASVTTDVATRADLRVTKAAASESPIAGGREEYVLTVVNSGPSTARDVVLTDLLPAGAAFVSAVPQAGCTTEPPEVVCELGDLVPGAITVVQVTVELDAELAGETLTNRVEVTSPTADDDGSDNSAELEQQISARSDLQLTKTVTSGPVVAGEPVTYAVSVQNLGPSRAEDVQVLDLVGPELAYRSATATGDGDCAYDARTETADDDDRVTCDWAVVEVGQTRTASLTFDTAETLAEGAELTNRATATSAAPDPSPAVATATSEVGTRADVGVTKSLLSGLPVAGAEVRWQILVTNPGPSLAADVTVTDVAATGVIFTDALTPQGSCTVTAGEVVCALGTVGTDPVTVTVVADLDADYDSAALANSASVSTSTTDPDTEDNTATVTTSAAATADLALTKTAGTEPVVAGTDVTWTVAVANTGPSTARDVSITDALPVGVALVSTALPGGSCTRGATVVCTVASLAPGATATLTLVGRLAGSYPGGQLTNTAAVSAATADPDPLDNSATAVSTVARSADLALAKTGPAAVDAGDRVTWQLTANNAGPSSATATVVTDTPPAWLTDVKGTYPGGSCSLSGADLVCPVGTLAAGDDVVVTVTGRVPADQPAGPLVNRAVVTSAVADPDPADQPDPDHEAVTTGEVTRSAEVSVTKVATTADVTPGRPVGWTVTATNAGPSTAESVTVTDAVPAGISDVEATLAGQPCPIAAGTVTCAVGVLSPGIPAIISITGTLDATAGSSSLVNSATISSATPDPTPEDLTSTVATPVDPSADVSVGKQITTGTPVAGAPIGYAVTVASEGPSVARDVQLSDTMPAEVTIDSVTTTAGSCSVSGQQISCDLGDLAAGAEVTVTVAGTVSQAFEVSIANAAAVTSTTEDPDPSDNQTSSVASVDEEADLSVTKEAPAEVSPGEVVEWQLEVSNAGPSDAREVSLTDLLPTGITFLSATADDGSACTVVVVCDLGTLSAAETVGVTIRGRLSSSSTEPALDNNAIVTAASADPDTTDNTAATTTAVQAEVDLAVEVSLDPTALTPGEDADLAIVATNAGPSTATGVTVVHELPAGFVLRSPPTAVGADCVVTGRTVACFAALVEPGGTITIDVPVTLAASYTPTELSASATVSGVQPDADTSDNTDSVTAEVAARADLSLVKTGAARVTAGAAVGWQLAVHNDGPSDAQGVVVTDTLPLGVGTVLVSATRGTCSQAGRTLSCVLGTLAAGADVTIELRTAGVLDPDTAPGDLTNTATVTSPTADNPVDDPADPSGGRTDTVTSEVVGRADVEVYKVPTAVSAVAGGSIGWTITVVNRGPSTARDVVLTEDPGAGLTGVVVDPPSGVSCTPERVCTIGDLAAGLENAATFTVTADLPSGLDRATVANTAAVALETTDPDPGDNESRSVLPVTTAGDVSVTKEPSTDEVVPGERVSWLLTVGNDGPSDATAVVLSDALPSGLSDVVVDEPAGVDCTSTEGVLSCDVGVLPAGAEVAVTVSGLLAPDYADATLTNSAEVTAAGADPDPADNLATATVAVGGQVDLGLTKTGPDGPVVPGEPVAWTLALTNDGPSTGRGITLTDEVPAGVTGVTAEGAEGGPASCAVVGNVVSCTVAELAADAPPVLVEVRGVLDPAYAGASLANTATVVSDTEETDPASNTATATNEVDGSADLSLTKSVSPDPIVAGGTATFVLLVDNDGPSAARGTTVVDTLADGLTVTAASSTAGGCAVASQQVTCDLGDLPVTSEPVRIEISVDVAADADPDGFANSAFVSSETDDPDPGDNTGQVSGETTTRADLSLTKEADLDEVAPGGTVVWTLTASNDDGPATARAVTVTDTLPAGVTLDAAALDDRCSLNEAETVVTCALGDLDPEDSVAITITGAVSADATGEVSNSAAVQSATTDPDSTDDAAQVVVPVVVAPEATADLSLTKELLTDPLVAGRPATWRLRVANDGPAAATAVAVTDTLPSGVTFTAGSEGCAAVGRTVTCRVAELADGAAEEFTVTGDVASSVSGTVVNSAAATSSTVDPDPEDASVTLTSPVTRVADLGVTKVASTGQPVVGQDFTYTLTVTNDGPSHSTGAQLVEDWPDGLTLVRAEPSQGTYSATGQVWDLGTLADAGTATLVLTVRATAPGQVSNSVTLEPGDATDPQEDNGVATAGVTAEPAAPAPGPDEPPTTGPTTGPATDPTTGPADPRPRGPLSATGGPALGIGLVGLLLALSGGLMIRRRRR